MTTKTYREAGLLPSAPIGWPLSALVTVVADVAWVCSIICLVTALCAAPELAVGAVWDSGLTVVVAVCALAAVATNTNPRQAKVLI